MFDAAIVGGGLAGCALALRLRAAGHAVVVVDRARFPREKPCGEGMLPAGVGVLRELGLGELLRAIEAPAIRALEFATDGVSARGLLPGEGAGLDRRRFDDRMARAAQDAGAHWLEGAVEGLVRDGRGRVCGLSLASGARVEASVVVGADGLRSWTRRALGLLGPERARAPRYGLCARVEVPHPAGHHVEVHLVPGVGELYVTPTGAHQLSLALLAPRPAVSALRGSLPAAVRAASERSPALRARLWGASPLGRATATGPLASRAVRPFALGALLAGDAALAVDPIGGDGMTLAMLGSAPCADAVRALLAGTDPRAVGRRYERALREVSQRRALFVRALLGLAARPALARRVLAGLALAPVAVTALCALHEGRAPGGGGRGRA